MNDRFGPMRIMEQLDIGWVKKDFLNSGQSVSYTAGNGLYLTVRIEKKIGRVIGSRITAEMFEWNTG